MRTPLSVLIVGINYAPETTGIAPYSTGLAEDLAGRGHRVRTITSHAHYPQWAFLRDRPPKREREYVNDVSVDRRLHRLPARPGGLSRALSEISFGIAANMSKFGRPDAVVLVSPALLASSLTFIRSRLFRRVPVVVWVQDLYSLGLRELDAGRPGAANLIVAAIERWLLRHADRVVVIHERFRDTVVNEMGVRPAAVDVIRNWAHVEVDADVDRAAARKALGWNDEDLVVLHAGNMGVKQGLENVVDAGRRAQGRGARVRFVLLGDGNQRRTLEVAARGVPNVELLDPLPDAEFQRALRAADVLLVNERPGVGGMAVPSKLTTYFATGLPVIAATDATSITASEVRLADAGVVVPPDDPEALLEAAESLANDPTGAAAMGAAGRAFRAERLSARASLDSYARLLEDLVAGRVDNDTPESELG